MVKLGHRKHFGRTCACQVGPSKRERVAGVFSQYGTRHRTRHARLYSIKPQDCDIRLRYDAYGENVVCGRAPLFIVCWAHDFRMRWRRHATNRRRSPSNHDCHLEHASSAFVLLRASPLHDIPLDLLPLPRYAKYYRASSMQAPTLYDSMCGFAGVACPASRGQPAVVAFRSNFWTLQGDQLCSGLHGEVPYISLATPLTERTISHICYRAN